MQEAPFFTEKLQVKVLPCVIVFLSGVATERLIGFDVFGNRDDFTTEQMTSWLVRSGAITIRSAPPPPSMFAFTHTLLPCCPSGLIVVKSCQISRLQ